MSSALRVAALYDIHGNLPALEAVLHDVQQAGVDQVVVGGDVVPGPMPRETVTALLNLDVPALFITGNGEREVLAMLAGVDTGNVPEQYRGTIRWAGQELTPEQARILGDWPQTVQLGIPGLGDVLFCHATPRDDNEVFTRLRGGESIARAIEQSRSEPGFQRLQSAIHRRMVQTQHARGAAQRPRSQDREKDAQIVPVNG